MIPSAGAEQRERRDDHRVGRSRADGQEQRHAGGGHEAPTDWEGRGPSRAVIRPAGTAVRRLQRLHEEHDAGLERRQAAQLLEVQRSTKNAP